MPLYVNTPFTVIVHLLFWHHQCWFPGYHRCVRNTLGAIAIVFNVSLVVVIVGVLTLLMVVEALPEKPALLVVCMVPLAVVAMLAPAPAALICWPPIASVPAILKVVDPATEIEEPVPNVQLLAQLVVGVLLFCVTFQMALVVLVAASAHQYYHPYWYPSLLRTEGSAPDLR